MVKRRPMAERDEDYYRLAENIYNSRKKFISNKADYRREYADFLRRMPEDHPIRKKKVLERTWKDYKTLAQAEVFTALQEGKTVKRSKRRSKDLVKYDTKGRIQLKEEKS